MWITKVKKRMSRYENKNQKQPEIRKTFSNNNLWFLHIQKKFNDNNSGYLNFWIWVNLEKLTQITTPIAELKIVNSGLVTKCEYFSGMEHLLYMSNYMNISKIKENKINKIFHNKFKRYRLYHISVFHVSHCSYITQK